MVEGTGSASFVTTLLGAIIGTFGPDRFVVKSGPLFMEDDV